ncbi:MAG: hypothetical protein ABI651_16270, partial [Verrucomicrobiota bacterium]
MSAAPRERVKNVTPSTRADGETPTHRVFHPDVLVEFFPPQGQSLQAETHLFKLGLRGIGEQRIFAGRETHQPLIGQFQSDAAV